MEDQPVANLSAVTKAVAPVHFQSFRPPGPPFDCPSSLRRRPVPGFLVFLMDPDAIRAVMVDRSDDFPHGALFRRMRVRAV